MFGLSITDPQIRYWGARAIYKNQQIDLLHDRQSSQNLGENADSKAFMTWLNERALPWLRRRVKELSLGTDDPQLIVLPEFKYELRACTNASYGYLYIGAVEHQLIERPPIINPAFKNEEKVVAIGDQEFVIDDGTSVLVGTMGKIKVNNIGPAKVVGYDAIPRKVHCQNTMSLQPLDSKPF